MSLWTILGGIQRKKEQEKEVEPTYTPEQQKERQEEGQRFFDLGMECIRGSHKQTKDEKAGVEWLLRAAELGHVEGQYRIGVAFEIGSQVEQNDKTAVKWYTKAAHQGHKDAQTSLGDAYRKGQGAQADQTESVRWYEKAAEQGDMHAQYNIGLAYEDGNGVCQDAKTAAEWYRRCADQGFATGMHNLGVLYLMGKGVEEDAMEGVKWLRLAAEAGSDLSKDLLEKCQLTEDDSESESEDDQDDNDDDQPVDPHLKNWNQPEEEKYLVKLYSTCTKTTALSRAHEARLRHLLESKGIGYDFIDLDYNDNRDRAKAVQAISGTDVLPQLHVNGKYFGDYVILQEMEDCGKFDAMLEEEGITAQHKAGESDQGPRFLKKRSGVTVQSLSGVMSAHATKKFIQLRWSEHLYVPGFTTVERLVMVKKNSQEEAAEKQKEQEKVHNKQWLLLMDDEAVYVGHLKQHLVHLEGTRGTHNFALYEFEEPETPESILTGGAKPVAELSVCPPRDHKKPSLT